MGLERDGRAGRQAGLAVMQRRPEPYRNAMASHASDFFDRFTAAGRHDDLPPAPPAGLQLLADRPLPGDPAAVAEAIRLFHPTLAAATVEWVPVSAFAQPVAFEFGGEGPPVDWLGLASWGEHTVKLMGFDAAMPAAPLSRTLAHSLFVPNDLKAVAGRHRSHWLFDYAGRDPRPVERYAATALIAGAVANFGGIVALNEEARACVPAAALQPEDDREDVLAVLRGLPLPYLYGGFAKLELSDPPGAIWYRTFLNARFGLPNLAVAGTHETFTESFQLFTAMLNYLAETGLDVQIGETIRVDDERYFVARKPGDAEWFLESDEGITVVLDPGRSSD